MRLGSDTGSVVNYIQGNATRGQPTPEIGMGVTYLSWTDRHPGTVVSVFEKGGYRYIGTQEDTAKRTDDNGFSESQEYEYTPNTEAYVQFFRQKKNEPDSAWKGCYINSETGRWTKRDSRIRIGSREKYHDFCF